MLGIDIKDSGTGSLCREMGRAGYEGLLAFHVSGHRHSATVCHLDQDLFKPLDNYLNSYTFSPIFACLIGLERLLSASNGAGVPSAGKIRSEWPNP